MRNGGPDPLIVCFVPGDPMAFCDARSGEVLGGMSVDYATLALGDRPWVAFCIQNATSAILSTCDLLLGKVGNIEATRYGAGLDFYAGPPYISSRLYLLYAYETPETNGWEFLRPFSFSVWMYIWISVVASGVAAMLIARGKKYSFIRTAPTAMIGVSRLYDETDASYFQHALSIAMALYSTVVFSLYSSNLLMFAFFKQYSTKKISDYTIISPWTHTWIARRDFPTNVFERVNVFDEKTGFVEESAIDLLRAGKHALLLERMTLDNVCGKEQNLWIHPVDSVRSIFFPFYKNASILPDLTRASMEYATKIADTYARQCPDESDMKVPTGVEFIDVWGLFAIVGGAMGIVLVYKFFRDCIFRS